ncbi:hypothetical protein AB1J28_15985 [Lysinibacillus irui]|uniref:hypothetical protein n=1 Tax=Lysinibacillus irui TaxID=2998077 RepID=UPI003D2A6A41
MRSISVETNSRQIQLGIIIVLFLSSLIIPVILLFPIQEWFYRPKEVYYFEPYLQAYIIFMAALLFMALALLINYLIIPETKKGKSIQRGILITSFLIALIFIALSFNHYKVMDSNGIHMNQFFSLKEDFVAWEEIVKAEQVNVKKDGATKPERLVFTLKDGSTIEEPTSTKLMLAKNFISFELNQRGLTIENVFE